MSVPRITRTRVVTRIGKRRNPLSGASVVNRDVLSDPAYRRCLKLHLRGFSIVGRVSCRVTAGDTGNPRLWDRSESAGGVAKIAPLTERLSGYLRRMTGKKANLVLGMARLCSGIRVSGEKH